MTDLLRRRRRRHGARDRHRLGLPGRGPGRARAQRRTIEIVEPLAQQARERLRALGYANVRREGRRRLLRLAEDAPFDAIIVTAAASHVPPPLVRQLKPGGRMVIPVGAAFLAQHLMLVEKRADGTVPTRQILPVRFVPLTGGH